MNLKERLVVYNSNVMEPYQSSYANYEKILIFVIYEIHAFYNLILPPPSETAQESSFEHAVENLIQDIEFIDYQISLGEVLSLLERRYTATSV